MALAFITYAHLSRADRILFAHCGFEPVLGVAAKLLDKRIGKLTLHSFDKPIFSDQDLRIVNVLTGNLLQLIGKFSNKRFGRKTKDQDRSFRKSTEFTTFPIHLAVTRWESTKARLISGDASNSKRLRQSERGALYSKVVFRDIPYANKVTFTRFRLSETETRAVGVFYMVSLIWLHVKAKSNRRPEASTSELISSGISYGLQLSSLLDTSDHLAARSKGGRNKNASERKIVDQVISENKGTANTKLVAKAKAELVRQGKALSRKAIASHVRKKNKPGTSSER